MTDPRLRLAWNIKRQRWEYIPYEPWMFEHEGKD